MSGTLWIRAMGMWLVIGLLALGNFWLRESLYVPLFGAGLAEITTAKLILVMLAVMCGFLVWSRPLYQRRHLPALALLWLLPFVGAEFNFSHHAGGALRRAR